MYLCDSKQKVPCMPSVKHAGDVNPGCGVFPRRSEAHTCSVQKRDLSPGSQERHHTQKAKVEDVLKDTLLFCREHSAFPKCVEMVWPQRGRRRLHTLWEQKGPDHRWSLLAQVTYEGNEEETGSEYSILGFNSGPCGVEQGHFLELQRLHL